MKVSVSTITSVPRIPVLTVTASLAPQRPDSIVMGPSAWTMTTAFLIVLKWIMRRHFKRYFRLVGVAPCGYWRLGSDNPYHYSAEVLLQEGRVALSLVFDWK